jgi:hypothetical protein
MFTAVTMKNADFCDITPFGSSKRPILIALFLLTDHTYPKKYFPLFNSNSCNCSCVRPPSTLISGCVSKDYIAIMSGSVLTIAACYEQRLLFYFTYSNAAPLASITAMFIDLFVWFAA